MIIVCYLIVCVKLLYSLDQNETFSSSKTEKITNDELLILLNSLTVENQDDYLAKIETPYWNLTYDEQLDKKQKSCNDIVDKIVTRSENVMTYKLHQIVPSPVTRAYRNKDEFHIRQGVDGNPKTVGLIFGSRKLGKIFSVHPTKIGTIRESHKRVAQVYENFIRVSPVAVNSKPYDGGHWNKLIVRSNEAGDVMAAVMVQPRGYSHRQIYQQKQSLKTFFVQRLPNINLFHQICRKRFCTHEEAPFNLLHGMPYLLESLSGYKFKILPDTSILVNTLGAEVMYDTLIRMAELKTNTTVIDIYSSLGSNSIVVSKFVKAVVRITTYTITASEAKFNAKFNEIHNVKLLLGSPNFHLNSVLDTLNSTSDVVVILNHRPRRQGLDVIKTIRESFKISRIIYILSKHNRHQAKSTFAYLCLSNNYSQFPPFRLAKVIPVDLYPQTPLIEILLIFERERISWKS